MLPYREHGCEHVRDEILKGCHRAHQSANIFFTCWLWQFYHGIDFSGIRTDSIFTYNGPKIDNSFELKLDLFGMELPILFSCPWHHISQQAIVLLLSSLSDDPVVCDDFYSLHVSKHFIFSLVQHLTRRADFKWHT